MFEYLYQWLENISFYLVIITVAMNAVPNNKYKKYIQFFSGLILVLMMSAPIFKVFGMEKEFEVFYENAEYQQKIEEIEEATKYLEDVLIEVK